METEEINIDSESMGLCQRCKDNPANDTHTCPYAVEIRDDSESLCNCCDSCIKECADDV